MAGLSCGKCLIRFKSYVKMRKHMSDEHGEVNEFSNGTTIKQYQDRWRESRKIAEDNFLDSKLRAR